MYRDGLVVSELSLLSSAVSGMRCSASLWCRNSKFDRASRLVTILDAALITLEFLTLS